MNVPSCSTGGTRSCSTGPSGRYILTGTLRTLYALSLSVLAEPPGSAEGGLACITEVEDAGGAGEMDRPGAVVGVILAATLQ